MKKIVLMVVAMMTMTMAHAENENVSNVADIQAYDMNVNMRRLAVTLGLNYDQMEMVEDIYSNFRDEMMLAAHAEKEERRTMVDNAARKNARYMRYVLDKKQYKTYLLLLNATLRNRGLIE